MKRPEWLVSLIGPFGGPRIEDGRVDVTLAASTALFWADWTPPSGTQIVQPDGNVARVMPSPYRATQDVDAIAFAYSEWLDGQGLVVGDSGPDADKRSHDELAKAFAVAWADSGRL